MIALGHSASLARAGSCSQTPLAIQSSMVCTEQARSLTFDEIAPIVVVLPQVAGGEGIVYTGTGGLKRGLPTLEERRMVAEGRREELARSFW
jgi:hypothetical protein